MIRQYAINHDDLEGYKQAALDNDYSVIIAKRGAVNSIFIPELQTKIVDKSQCQLVQNPITDLEEWLLPAEYARLWLKKLYPPYRVSTKYKCKQSVPNWYSGQFIKRKLVYFDLIGAYHQLYKHLYLDFTDIGMVYHYPLMEIAGRLSHWKAARNSLVGTLASNEICRLSGNEYGYLPSNKRDYYNPMILFFLNSLLTELANIALKLGACYIATDCHIFEYSRDWLEFMNILDKYKLSYRCISGQGSIYRFAAYNVSGHKIAGDKNSVGTATFDKISHYIDNPIYKNDPRINQLMIRWNRPIKHVDKRQSYDCLEFYKKLVT